MKYYQCRFSQGAIKTIAWIPENGAIEGKMVELKDLPIPTSEKMWHVDTVYQPGMDEERFKERQLLQRKWHNNI